MRTKRRIETELGEIEAVIITCDICDKKIVEDSAVDWFMLRVYQGNLDLTGDLCSIDCLKVFVNRLA